MNILVAATEVDPLAKSGGLADVTSTLPKEWLRYGQTPIVIMPKYGFINVEQWGFRPTHITLIVPMGYWNEYAHLWVGNMPGSQVPVYLVEHNGYFDRPGIYGDTREYGDNDRRFIFFSRAVFEAAKALNFKPDVIHAHDFHTAFIMAFLKTHYRHDPHFAGTAGVFTIHNLAYQGRFSPTNVMEYSGFGMKEFAPTSNFEFYGDVNFMKVGIMFADKITTVSPTYAKEIKYDYYGEGLQGVLESRSNDLIGILNGVYYDEWNPETDKALSVQYSPETLFNKTEVKRKFLYEYGLTESDNLDMPVIGLVSRLVEQKGIDLIQNIIEAYINYGFFRFVMLGSGDRHYEDYFNYLQWKYPKKALINLGYNNHLSHKIIAASDYFLMPSRFEPCGLTQMYAMRYGTIPIVRQTGGLADTVHEYQPDYGTGTGFLFWQYNADDLAYAIRRALSIYRSDPHWDMIRKNAMAENFSSGQTALEYLKIFNQALEKVR